MEEVLNKLAPFFPHLSDETQFQWSESHNLDIIQARNQQPGDSLFIDDLLSLISISPSSDDTPLYPPSSPASLNSLLFQLLTAQSGQLRSNCVIFYLLLADPLAAPSQSNAISFARSVHLPLAFTRSVEAFYALDSHQWKAAVSALTDPHLTPDFVDKTLVVLSTLPPVDERAELVLSFVRLAGIEVKGEAQIGLVVDALCDRTRKFGVTEAWDMMRKSTSVSEIDEGEESMEDPTIQATLLERVLLRCFGDNPTRTPVSHHLHTLLSHPLSPDEDTLVTAFCLSPPQSLSTPASVALAADWRITKLVAEGRPVDALRFGRQISLKQGQEARSRLLRAVRETLTDLQRNQIELEIETTSSSSLLSTSSTTLNPAPAKSSITTPAWQPVPLPPPSPLPRSLLSLNQPPPPQLVPSATDLPLSASPFLRRERPLVSTLDGSSIGGAGKNILRAVREGTDTTSLSSPGRKAASLLFPGLGVGGGRSPSAPPTSERGGPSSTINGGSVFGGGSPRLASPFNHSGGEQARKERKATLSGFGSVRLQGPGNYGFGSPASKVDGSSWRGDAEVHAEDDRDEDMFSPPPPDTFSNIQRQQQVSSSSSLPFEIRATLDPVIASTIAAANPSPSAPPKRRTFSSQQLRTQTSTSGDKRRAVSTEAEDRPSSSIGVGSSSTGFPGAFPGNERDEEEDRSPEPEAAKKKPIRRSVRASSVTPAAATTPVPRTRRATSVQPEEPKSVAVRRSTRRIATSGSEQEGGKKAATPANKRATGSRRTKD